jgi:hypothetical protein
MTGKEALGLSRSASVEELAKLNERTEDREIIGPLRPERRGVLVHPFHSQKSSPGSLLVSPSLMSRAGTSPSSYTLASSRVPQEGQ